MPAEKQNPLAQHFEKLILLGSIFFLVIVVAVFMAGIPFKPFQVKVSNQSMDVTELPDLMSERSQALLSELGQDQITEAPDVADYSNEWQARISTPVADQPRLTMALGDMGFGKFDASSTKTQHQRLVVPRPPMPDEIEVKYDRFVLDEAAINATAFNPQQKVNFYRGFIGRNKEPADFPVVSVAGTFDMDNWVSRLNKDYAIEEGEETVRRAIPQGYWQDKLFITGVYLLRETRNIETGKWEDRRVIQSLHTEEQQRFDLEATDPRPAVPLIESVASQEFQTLAMQPEVPPLKHGDVWTAPGQEPELLPGEFGDGTGLDLGAMTPAERRRMQREERQANLRNNRNRQASSEAELMRQMEREFSTGRSAAGGRNSAGRGSTGRGARASSSSTNDRRAAQAREAQMRREQAAAQREMQMLRELEREGRGAIPGAGARGGEFGAFGGDPENLGLGKREIWAHDMTVEPGQTYRYKLLVSVLNPLFGVSRLPRDQVETYTQLVALGPDEADIEATEWTEDVVIPPTFEFFFVGGSENRPAEIEVWRVYDARLVNAKDKHSPGDPIGQPEGPNQPDLLVGAIVVDVETSRDPQTGQNTHRLLYLDQSGQMKVRELGADSGSDRRKELRERQRVEQQRDREVASVDVGG